MLSLLHWLINPVIWVLSPLTILFTIIITVLGGAVLRQLKHVRQRIVLLEQLAQTHLGGTGSAPVRVRRSADLLTYAAALDSSQFHLLAEHVRDFADSTYEVSRDGGDHELYSTQLSADLTQAERFRAELGSSSWSLRWLPPAMIDAAPGLLTSIGILGTFLGLVLGLYAARAAGTAEMPMDIEGLMAGLSVSFISSVVGLMCSIVVTLVSRSADARVMGALSDTLLRLDRSVVRRPQQKILEDLLVEQSESRGALQTLKTDLSEAIERALNAAVEQHLAPTFQRLEAHTAEMKDATLSLADGSAQRQVEGMSMIVSEFKQQMDDAIGHQLAAAGQQLLAYADAQRRITDDFSASTQDFSSAIDRLEDTTDGQTSLAEAFRAAMAAGINVSEGFNSAAAQLAAAAPHLQEASQVAEQMTVQAHDAIGTLSEQQSASLARATQHTEAFFEGLQRQSDRLEASWGKMSSTLDANLAGLTGNLRDAATRLESASKLLNAGAAGAKDAAGTTASVMREQAYLQQKVEASLGEAAKLGSIVAASANSMGELQRQLTADQTRLHEIMNGLQQVTQRQSKSATETLEAAIEIQDTLRSRLQDWSEVTNEFRELQREIATSMSTFAGQFPERLRDNLEVFDEELGRAVDQLNQSYSSLRDQVDVFNDSFADAVARLPERR